MAINFPTSLDNFTNPSSGNTLDSPSHSLQHSDINDAVEALEAKVGIGVSPAGSATSGQVLTAQGGGTALWATPSIAGLTLINKTVVSNLSTQTFAGLFTSTYENYKIIVTDFASNTSNAAVRFRFGTNGTPNTSSAYTYGGWTVNYAGTTSTAAGNVQSSLFLTYIQNNKLSSVVIDVFRPQLTSMTLYNYYGFDGQNARLHLGSGWFDGTTSFTDFVIFPDSNNFYANVRTYGYKND